jgi:hypothetical protein
MSVVRQAVAARTQRWFEQMKTLLAIWVVAAMLALTAGSLPFAAPAAAKCYGCGANGVLLNGIRSNGVWGNGTYYQGSQMQGTSMQGTRTHGTPAEVTIGSAILVGVELPR